MTSAAHKSTYRVLGIMSGTSLDGVDYALCAISSSHINLIKLWSVPYPAALHRRLLAAASNWLSSYEVAQLHHDLGRFYADHSPKVQCDYVGLHGQTIFHNPKKPYSATSQIGEPAYLAARLNKTVVSQFRNMDLAMGGQGAPLATLFHKKVFGKKNKIVAVNNLGGISNVTFLGSKIFSFDTGPANILIDYAMDYVTKGRLKFDKNGETAARGIPNKKLVDLWLKNSFIKLKPPKSTGREDFGPAYFKKALDQCKKVKLKNEDIVATFALFTAESIAINYSLHLPQFPEEVILCGGGASNPTLVKMITRSLRDKEWARKKVTTPVQVMTSDQIGWPSQAIEASAFALLAYQTITGKAGNIPRTTGASRAAILGQITPSP